MILYLAGKVCWEREEIIPSRPADLNILESFYYVDDLITSLIPHLKHFMLDSGAFTFFTQGKHVDWDEYVSRYIDYIKANDIKLFFELDIDSLVGYDSVKEIRRRLERETGKIPIPVWHKSRGKEEFLRMCDEYDYVAIGSEKLTGWGMVSDFQQIKNIVMRLDHKNVNEVIDMNPTAENIAYWLCQQIPDCIKVEVQESEGNTAIYEV